MGSQKQKRFTWVLENFSEDKSYESRHFVVSGCKWRLLARSTRHRNDYYLSLYLEVSPSTNLRSGWRRNVEFYLTLVNKGGKSNKESGDERCFDAKHMSWGFPDFLSLYKLRDRRRGFMVNNRLTIQAELHVLPGAVTPLKTLSCKEENQAKYASDEYLDDDDDEASEESDTDDDDDNDEASKESDTDDDDNDEESDTNDDDEASEESDTDDDDDDDTYEDASEKSSDDIDDASLDNGGKEFNTMTSVNGFEVFSSQVESVKLIFERHPDITVGFCAKNQHLRNACMNFLLSLIETLCQSLQELSNEDLVEADIALTYLKDTGFKVDWLEKKLDKLMENKEKEKSSLVRLQEIEEALMKLKQEVSEMNNLAEKEKAELSATRTPMSFHDLV